MGIGAGIPDWDGLSFRARVALMRELGVITAFGITLGPEPRAPSKLDVLGAKVGIEDSKEARRDLRVELAREDIRAKLGQWDLSAEQCDRMLDPSVFELV